MTILVTGAAGFIGFHLAKALLAQGQRVIGVDNLNDYYDVQLKHDRLAQLESDSKFTFVKCELSDIQQVKAVFETHKPTKVVHLAAQAGVRHSLIDPYSYVTSNVMAQTVLLEQAKLTGSVTNFVYASSSSVYGSNKKQPFSIEDRTDLPMSLYAATKKSCEYIARTYAHLYDIPCTGLRFFTVYGPWGRPDMAAYIFTKAIFEGTPIRVNNHGKMKRDFTYVDDIVSGVIGALGKKPALDHGGAPHQVYNLGGNNTRSLMEFIEIIEDAVGQKAIKEMVDIPAGDVPETSADVDASIRDLDYRPQTRLEVGLPKFVEWYRQYRGVMDIGQKKNGTA